MVRLYLKGSCKLCLDNINRYIITFFFNYINLRKKSTPNTKNRNSDYIFYFSTFENLSILLD